MRYLLLLLISLTVMAQNSLEDCSNKAKLYLNQAGTSLPSYPSACFPFIWAQKSDHNFDESSDNFVHVIGTKNMVLAKVWGLDANNNTILVSEHIITGNLTKLHDIQAIDFNEADGRFYVLNKSADGHQQVYSYVYSYGGNSVPARKLINNPDVDDASNIRMDTNYIYLISKTHNWIKTFHKFADPNGPAPEHSTATLKNIAGAATTLNSPVDIALSNTEIFVLEGSRVLVFNKSDSGDVAPKRVLEGLLTTLSGAKKIEIEGSELHITNGNNAVIKFANKASGNQAPFRFHVPYGD